MGCRQDMSGFAKKAVYCGTGGDEPRTPTGYIGLSFPNPPVGRPRPTGGYRQGTPMGYGRHFGKGGF